MTTEPLHPATFTVQRLVRFSDCDPAGMVFYPQYFVMLNGLVEDWFTQGLQVDYAQLLGARRIGLPLVALQCEFKAPSRMGETIRLHLQLHRQGTRSLGLSVRCMGTETTPTLRWIAQATLVSTSLDHDGAITLPPDVQQGIARWQSHSGETV